MGLAKRSLLLLWIIPGILAAAPKLRLTATTVGPVSISTGANGSTQTVEAYNIGDGSLNLTLTSSATWISASAGSQRACTSQPGSCIPLNFALNTSGLSSGIQTGIVTVSDPNAIDAPQTITVTVQIGGGIPGTVDLYVAPGSSRDVNFSTNSLLTLSTRTTDGGNWLSVALDSAGSFRFVYPYHIRIAAPAGMATGTYGGSATVSGSSFGPDNKAVGVTMRVTTQPIAVPSTDRVKLTLAQGSAPLTTTVSLANVGQGTLTVSGAAASTESGGSWLTATAYNVGGLIPGGASLTIDPGSLGSGTYRATLTFASNAVNSSVSVPVELEIVPAAAPRVDYLGVQDNATFIGGQAVARGDIVAVKGQQLSLKAPANTSAPPLATQLADTQVLLNGTPLPLFYTSYGQINCQIPFDAPLGQSVLQVRRDNQTSNSVSVEIAARAPRILRLGIGDYGVIVNQDGSFPLPSGSVPGVNVHPAKAGDVLVLYAIGFGGTNPAVPTGAAAPGLSGDSAASTAIAPIVNFGGGIGGIRVTPLFAGLTPGFVGLYQINVAIPAGLPKGPIDLTVSYSDAASNPIQVEIQ